MDWTQWLILVSACSVVAASLVQSYRRKWTLTDVTNVTTIYGVTVGLLLLFRVSPQLIKVEPTESVRISSVQAEQWVSDFDRSESLRTSTRLEEIPLGKFQLYVYNSGTAVAADLALEFWHSSNTLQEAPIFSWVAYLFPDGALPLAGSLKWTGPLPGTVPVYHYEGWRRIYLPPLRPGGYLGVLVGLTRGVELDEERFSKIVRREDLTIRVIRASPPTLDSGRRVVATTPSRVVVEAKVPWGSPSHIDVY